MDSMDIEKMLDILFSKYPDAKTALHYKTPFELLVATILSAQCTDERINIVTGTLFKKYTNLEDYIDVSIETLEVDIKSTGFYKNKAKSIKECAAAIKERFKGQVPKTMEELVTLAGVGRKTASVILAAIFNVPAIAVDTHVLRVSNRLGLVKTKDPFKVEMALRGLIPIDKWIHFGMSIVLFGRQVCRAKKPLCGVWCIDVKVQDPALINTCTLYSLCQWSEKDVGKPNV